MDHKFALAYKHELRSPWQLVDEKGHVNWVNYNMDSDVSRMYRGWKELREFYNLDGDHMILFRFVDESMF